VTLPPGGFKQFNAILATSGLAAAQGYVRVERVSGKAPFYAYAVVNDQVTSDGTFITPVPDQALHGETQLVLPAVVETPVFSSELVLTNWSAVRKSLNFVLGQNVANGTTDFVVSLNPGEQTILPDFVQWLRDHGVANIGPKGGNYAWTLIATVDSGDASGLFMGSRTTTAGGGGRLGVAYPAVPYDQATEIKAWVYGLQQNAENRSNLAIVNSAGIDRYYSYGCCQDIFRIELFDGETGLKVGSVDSIAINPGEWKQFDNILSQYAPGTTQGYALVTHTNGRNPFIAYAVINDGGQPGERTGDGAFISSVP